jgi:hypothetical protein
MNDIYKKHGIQAAHIQQNEISEKIVPVQKGYACGLPGIGSVERKIRCSPYVLYAS